MDESTTVANIARNLMREDADRVMNTDGITPNVNPLMDEWYWRPANLTLRSVAARALLPEYGDIIYMDAWLIRTGGDTHHEPNLKLTNLCESAQHDRCPSFGDKYRDSGSFLCRCLCHYAGGAS